MAGLVAAAEAIAAQLTAAGIRASADPGWAAANRPCVLVPPPAVDYVARTNTWRLAALSGKDGGGIDSLHQLDQLVQAVIAVLPVEAADPGSYVLAGGSPPVPSYVLRITT